MREITIKRPDDWHLHLRDGAMLASVVADTAAHFGRALVMPNLTPPITSVAAADKYRKQIIKALPPKSDFTPLMTLYMTEGMAPETIAAVAKTDFIKAVKLYPLGATTNAHNGVADMTKIYPVLEQMEASGVVLAIHGEINDPEIDIFDREKSFINKVLIPLRQKFPALKITLEHITTKEAVDYVASCANHLAATITVHHLFINRNAMLAGGIRPHYYCLPVAKRESHRQALVAAAISGDKRYFLGTDSAPHLDKDKLSACGCAGIYTAPVAMACLAQLFDEAGALDKLEGFASIYGAAWYGLPVNETQLTLIRSDTAIDLPKSVQVGRETLTVFDPMRDIYWSVAPSLVWQAKPKTAKGSAKKRHVS